MRLSPDAHSFPLCVATSFGDSSMNLLYRVFLVILYVVASLCLAHDVETHAGVLHIMFDATVATLVAIYIVVTILVQTGVSFRKYRCDE